MASEIKIRVTKQVDITQALRNKAAAVVAKTAFDIEAAAKANAPVRTGALRSSIQTELHREGNAFISRATAVIRVGVEYGVFVEYGTKRMPAQPFLTPAVEANRRAFIAAIEQVFNAR